MSWLSRLSIVPSLNAMPPAKFATVDAYLAALPESSRDVLQRVRAILQRALPEAHETISYNIPAYKVDGAAVIYFAGWKQHYSLYPVSERVVAACGGDMASFEVQKGTLRLPLDAPIPEKLITKISKLLAAERSSSSEPSKKARAAEKSVPPKRSSARR